MDEEKIFGPLTFRQFIYAAGGALIVYFIYNNFAQKISIPFSILVAAVAFVFVRRAEPPPLTEENIRIKKSKMSREEFERWCQRKIAMIQFQISVREQKGLRPDPSFEKVQESLEALMHEK